jgi:hypothetical protein
MTYVSRGNVSRQASVFYACCLAGTVGPLLLAFAAR